MDLYLKSNGIVLNAKVPNKHASRQRTIPDDLYRLVPIWCVGFDHTHSRISNTGGLDLEV
jgi:hypothetical protein